MAAMRYKSKPRRGVNLWLKAPAVGKMNLFQRLSPVRGAILTKDKVRIVRNSVPFQKCQHFLLEAQFPMMLLLICDVLPYLRCV